MRSDFIFFGGSDVSALWRNSLRTMCLLRRTPYLQCSRRSRGLAHRKPVRLQRVLRRWYFRRPYGPRSGAPRGRPQIAVLPQLTAPVLLVETSAGDPTRPVCRYADTPARDCYIILAASFLHRRCPKIPKTHPRYSGGTCGVTGRLGGWDIGPRGVGRWLAAEPRLTALAILGRLAAR